MTDQSNPQDLKVNDVPVSDLSAPTQKLFEKLLKLKKETDELRVAVQVEQGASVKFKQLSENDQVKLDEGQTLQDFFASAAQATDQAAQQAIMQYEAKNATIKELSEVVLEEVNEIKQAQAEDGYSTSEDSE